MLNGEIKKRMLPQYKSRKEMIDILCEEEYGRIPQIPFQMTFDETEDFIPNFCAGKAISKKLLPSCK